MIAGCYTLWIPDWRPCTLNQMLGGSLRNRIRLKKSDMEIIAGYFMKSGIPKAIGKRRIDVSMALSARQRVSDPDARWKSLLDGLVKCGGLVDDSAMLVELGTVTQSHEYLIPGTKITLTEIP